jgi:hypothetical protein
MKPQQGFGDKMNEKEDVVHNFIFSHHKKIPLAKILLFFFNKFIEIRYKCSQVCEEM